MLEKIKKFYWKTIPYEYRPHHLWYQLKCFIWHRYTTIKPRHLDHTWCDRCTLLPYMMFEILSQFIEQECDPGIVDWDATDHHKHARKEMQELYDWWYNVYHKIYPEIKELLWKEAEKHNPIDKCDKIVDDYFGECYSWELQFETEEDKIIYHKCLDALNKLDRIIEKDLESKMYRLVKIRSYLWT